MTYSSEPGLLRKLSENLAPDTLIILDEVQRVPALLDEVHWLIENHKRVFGLCGSSARKVRRGHANLLGGRATRYELFGLVYPEYKDAFDLERVLNNGILPRHYLSEESERVLQTYVKDYLAEEIVEEGLVRNLPVFSRFLEIAAITDTEMLNFTNIGRECGVSAHTSQAYFQILEDTLLGRFLHSYIRRPKRRLVRVPKFYFSDVGTAGFLAGRGHVKPRSALFGKSFENWIYHELYSHQNYSGLFYPIRYFRSSGGIEVDFILGDMDVAIEVKASDHVRDHHLKSLRKVAEDYKIRRRICVSLEPRGLKTDDGIEILPVERFLEELWEGEIIK